MSDENIDYQSGEHSIDRTPTLSGDKSSFIEFDFEARAIFKRLADDIYESRKAGIREPLANALTAIIRAEREHGVENGVVEISLHKDDGLRLIMQDNGIGISKGVLEEVLTVIGRSMNRDSGDISGKYGIGFLACYKLVGTDGGFIMHTRSRKTDDYTAGIWKPGGFEEDTLGELPQRFDKDQYGTRFEFFLKPEIEEADIKSWVKKYAKLARKPVIYREFSEKGKEIFNEDYGNHTLIDEYPATSPVVVFENEYLKAVTSPNASRRTILLDYPIERNYRGTTESPWQIDIRLKNENGVIMEGPNAGFVPVNPAEYKEMDQQRKEKYIPTDETKPQDIRLPNPIGTRDTLEKHEKFWEWVGKVLREEYKKQLANILNNVEDYTDFLDLNEREQRLLMSGFDKLNLRTDDETNLQTSVENELGVTISEELSHIFYLLTDSVKYVPRGGLVKSGDKGDRKSKEIWKVSIKSGTDGEVYMGKTLNQAKAQVVWEDSEENQVIAVSDTDMYKVYSETLGWKKLKEITSRTISQFDISQGLKNKFVSSNPEARAQRNAGKRAPEREISVHLSESRDIERHKAKHIKETFKARHQGKETSNTIGFKTLVVFPSSSNYKISNYYWLAQNPVIGLAKTNVAVYEYLKEEPQVRHIEEHLHNSKDAEVFTSEGLLTFHEIHKKGDPIVHMVNDEIKSQLTNSGVMDRVKDYLNSKEETQKHVSDNIIYIPLTDSELAYLRPMIHGVEIKENTYPSVPIIGPSEDYDIGESLEIDETEMYIHSKLPRWKGTKEVQLAKNSIEHIKQGHKLIETFGKLHDAGKMPKSEKIGQIFKERNEVYKTSAGRLTPKEADNQGLPVYHILSEETIDYFREEDILTRGREYIKDINPKVHIDFQLKNVIYIPITFNEYDRLEETDFSTYCIIGDEPHSPSGKKIYLPSDTSLYAYARLPKWENTKIMNNLLQTSIPFREGGYKAVQTLAEEHDK